MQKLNWLRSRRALIGLAFALGISTVIFRENLFPGGWGIKEDKEITRTVERNGTGQIIKQTEVERIISGKTVWDWLNLAGVPLTLSALGLWFQWLQQKRIDEQTKVEREIAEKNAYFNRISILLTEKNLIALASKVDQEEGSSVDEERELLDTTVDTIQVATLSILNRLGDNAQRKREIIQFLIDSKVLSKLRLSLKGADLRGADLSGVKLQDVDLRRAMLLKADLTAADLTGANLEGADLSYATLYWAILNHAKLAKAFLHQATLHGAWLFEADLHGAQFVKADMSGAQLDGADMSSTNLSEANLQDASLTGANLFMTTLTATDLYNADLTEEQLSSAYLCRTRLPAGFTIDPNKHCEPMKQQ